MLSISHAVESLERAFPKSRVRIRTGFDIVTVCHPDILNDNGDALLCAVWPAKFDTTEQMLESVKANMNKLIAE